MKSDFNKGLVSSIIRQNQFNFLPKSHPYYTLAQELVIRGFSRRTVKTYLSINQRFLVFIRKSAKEVATRDIKEYLLYLKSQGQSNTSLNLAISALKFYYQQILKRKLFFNIQRPKREKYLPVVLSRAEIIKLIDSTRNLKHKLLLSLMYGSGLRVSEAVKIKINHLDLENSKLLVKAGKGNKDRWTILSDSSINLLNNYLKSIDVNQVYLFSGVKNKSHLSQRSAQKIFAQAQSQAGINKQASCHSLRHSFATHLLDNGTDISIIQKLLGHQNIKTTQIYAKVSDYAISKVISPLD